MKSNLLRISAPINFDKTADNPSQSNKTIAQKGQ